MEDFRIVVYYPFALDNDRQIINMDFRPDMSVIISGAVETKHSINLIINIAFHGRAEQSPVPFDAERFRHALRSIPDSLIKKCVVITIAASCWPEEWTGEAVRLLYDWLDPPATRLRCQLEVPFPSFHEHTLAHCLHRSLLHWIPPAFSAKDNFAKYKMDSSCPKYEWLRLDCLDDGWSADEDEGGLKAEFTIECICKESSCMDLLCLLRTMNLGIVQLLKLAYSLPAWHKVVTISFKHCRECRLFELNPIAYLLNMCSFFHAFLPIKQPSERRNGLANDGAWRSLVWTERSVFHHLLGLTFLEDQPTEVGGEWLVLKADRMKLECSVSETEYCAKGAAALSRHFRPKL